MNARQPLRLRSRSVVVDSIRTDTDKYSNVKYIFIVAYTFLGLLTAGHSARRYAPVPNTGTREAFTSATLTNSTGELQDSLTSTEAMANGASGML